MMRGRNSQEDILLSLTKDLDGGSWNETIVGWTVDGNLTACAWDGVICDPEDEFVIAVELPATGLRGTLPTEIVTLPKLESLILSGNEYNGTIPPTLFTHKKLESLNLSGNNLSGTIPFAPSSTLTSLEVGNNQLTGQLPDNIDELLPSMKLFDLSNNKLTGTIPHSFGNIEPLDFFDISANNFVGTIPASLGHLKHLQGLFLNDNKLIGTIPPSLTRSDGALIQLFLEKNFLSGTVPIGLADLPNLKDLYIDENKFTGSLPQELCNENLNQGFFEGTKYDSPDRDGCESVSCPVNSQSREGVYPCYPCSALTMNPFLGRVGRCYTSDEKKILDKLYDECGGVEWKSTYGWGLDNVSECDYEGVTCNRSGRVVNITLADHGLTGSLPEEIGFLRHLEILNLANNELEGQIPVSLKFPPLEELDISGNKFTGFVPPMLCLTPGINGNGEAGDFNCDFIACKPGFYSPSGHATLEDSCKPCNKKTDFLGRKRCKGKPFKTSGKKKKPSPPEDPITPEEPVDLSPPPNLRDSSVNTDMRSEKINANNAGSSLDLSRSSTSSSTVFLMLFAVALFAYMKKQRRDSRESGDGFTDSIGRGLRRLPRPNLNKVKVLQAKVMDKFNLPQNHSFETTNTVYPGLSEINDSSSDPEFASNATGEKAVIAKNTSEGAEEDDTSMVCRSGVKKETDDENMTVMKRRKVEENAPFQQTNPDIEDVSSYESSSFGESSDDSDDDDDDDSVSSDSDSDSNSSSMVSPDKDDISRGPKEGLLINIPDM